MPNNFGEILRALRKERGLTAVQLSKIVKDVDINNAGEIQYMFMNLYSQAYAEKTRMLENNHEYEDIYGIVLQQIIMMRVLIPKYFLAQRKGSH